MGRLLSGHGFNPQAATKKTLFDMSELEKELDEGEKENELSFMGAPKGPIKEKNAASPPGSK